MRLRTIRRSRSSLVVLLSGLVLVGCASADEASAPGPTSAQQVSTEVPKRLRVVAALAPLEEATRRIGGSEVEVVNLTGVGVEPHDVELTSDQIDQVLDADLVVYLGNGFQPSLEDVLKNRKAPSVDVLGFVKLLDGIAHEEVAHEEVAHEEGADEEHAATDPHVWLDPVRYSEIGGAITKELAKLRPKAATKFESNKTQWQAELATLHAEFDKAARSCERRELVTSHAAFGYLADRYSFTQVPISGLSPEAEPDPKRMAEIADLVKLKGATTIFTEELVSPKVAETIARETGSSVAVLSPIEGFTPDELDRGVTYVDKMRDNIVALRKALSCSG